MAGKSVIVSYSSSRQYDRELAFVIWAEVTDVISAVLDGADSIVFGAETLHGIYSVEAIKTLQRICTEAENVYNHPPDFKKVSKHAGEPTSGAESVASPAVGSTIKVKTSIVVVFTSSGRAARLIARYRPTMPVVAIKITWLQANSIRWTFTGSQKARQLLRVRGVHPILSSSDVATSGVSSQETGLKLALTTASPSDSTDRVTTLWSSRSLETHPPRRSSI